MSAHELRRKQGELKAVAESNDTWRMVGEYGSVLRKVQKACAAVEAAICELRGRPPTLDYATELHRSLEVRRSYARLRDEILGEGEPAAKEIPQRLRHVALAIAKLIGRDVYPELRVSDRLQFRELQRKLLGWLADRSADPAAGLRLWQDCAGFVTLLRQVSNRQDLLQHDQYLVGELLAQLAGLNPESGMSAELLETAHPLHGFEPEVDRLLKKGADGTSREWRTALSRIRKSRFGSAGSPYAPA
jgi:hypothetical protein